MVAQSHKDHLPKEITILMGQWLLSPVAARRRPERGQSHSLVAQGPFGCWKGVPHALEPESYEINAWGIVNTEVLERRSDQEIYRLVDGWLACWLAGWLGGWRGDHLLKEVTILRRKWPLGPVAARTVAHGPIT